MTTTPAVIGLSAGNRLLATSFGSTDLAPPDAHPSLRNHSAPALALAPPLPLPPPPADPPPELDTEFEFESSLEAIVLLQRSMPEKQWELPFEDEDEEDERLSKATVAVAWSGVSARQRWMSGRRRGPCRKNVTISPERWGELGHPPSMASGGCFTSKFKEEVRQARGAQAN
ncbi:RNA polymerase sigma factor sigA-like [Miscanthus floridulus]|uniref:RNA polymerase sigma factor sigA-like n=1 Tax=Miscanthus floridulus TaxID=154761 RepID=UPI003457B7DE